MIAFRTFQQAPREEVPLGIPLDYPWTARMCTEDQITSLRKEGWIVVTQEEYDANVLSLQERYDAWQEARLRLGIEEVVSSASRFGSELMITFAAENVLLGITQEGKTGEVLTKLAGVQLAMQAGSLYEAITRIRAIPLEEYDTKYITEARLLVFINKIEEYLGLPLSTEI